MTALLAYASTLLWREPYFIAHLDAPGQSCVAVRERRLICIALLCLLKKGNDSLLRKPALPARLLLMAPFHRSGRRDYLVLRLSEKLKDELSL